VGNTAPTAADEPGISDAGDVPGALRDVADIPAQDLRADDNDKMRYFLIGPHKGGEAPRAGYKLVIVMPGGDGSADFHPFIRRIFKHAAGKNYVFAQPVAVRWSDSQQIVWPTERNTVEGQKFSTEQFVQAIVTDVRRRVALDDKSIFTLSWSSSGPAAYAISLADETAVTGSYIAMSVFKPTYLPPLENAREHAYFIDHSPADRICPYWMAEAAKKSLTEQGAHVQLSRYDGGHGWRGDIYGRIRSGLRWLEQQTGRQP
jgi:predicted esterase